MLFIIYILANLFLRMMENDFNLKELLFSLDENFIKSLLKDYILLNDNLEIVSLSDSIKGKYGFLNEFVGEKVFLLFNGFNEELFRESINKGERDVYMNFDGSKDIFRINVIKINSDNISEKYFVELKKLSGLDFYKQRISRWENRYKLMQNQGEQLFFSFDFTTQKYFWGMQLNRVLGEEFNAGSTIEDIYLRTHLRHLEKLREGMRMVAFKNHEFHMEFEFEKEEGKYRWLKINANTAEIEGKGLQVHGVIEDIHDRKLLEIESEINENSFKNLLSEIDEVFFRTDKDGKFILISDAVQSIFNYDKDFLLGKSAGILYESLEDRNRLLEILKEDSFLQSYELRLKTSDDKTVIVNLNARYYYDGQGEVLGTEGMFYDITDKRNIELERKRVLNEFRNSLKGVNIQIYRYKKIDNKWIISFSEGEIAERANITTAKVGGKTFKEAFGIELSKEEKEAYSKAFAGNQTEFTSIIDGRYLRVEVAPYSRNSNGEVDEIIGVVYDITQVIETESKLKESEEKYRTFVEEANDGILILQDSKFKFCNTSFLKMLGYKREELIDTDIKLVLAEENRDKVYNNHNKRMKGDNVINDYEAILQKKNGEKFFVELSSKVIKFNNRNASLTFIRDLTQKKHSEKQIQKINNRNRILLENFPLAYIVVDKDLTINSFNNPESSDLEILSKHLKQGIHLAEMPLFSENIDIINQEIKECFDDNKYHIQNINSTIDGKTYYLLLGFVYLAESELLISIDNITGQIENEKNLIKQKEKAMESERLKTAFLANMSHELRTPLNAIIGFSEMIKYSGISENEKQEYTNIINQRSKDLLALLNNILETSKIEAKSYDLAFAKTDLKELTYDVFNSFNSEPKIVNGNINYSIKYFLNPKYQFYKTDSTKLKQIITNLINNAIKFTEEGKVELRVYNTTRHIKIDVIDTGIGIDEKDKDEVFKRFIQADMKSTRKFEGAGLGLSISKGLAEIINAELDLKSKTGKGSVFSLKLGIG